MAVSGNRWVVGVVALAGVATMWALAVGPGDDAASSLVGQCIDNRDDPVPAPVVCITTTDGQVIEMTEIELAGGLPFAVDSSSKRIAALDSSGDLVLVRGGSGVIATGVAEPAVAFTNDGVPVFINERGVVTDLDREPVTACDVDGEVDLSSGVDVDDDSMLVTVASGAGFVVVVCDLGTGAVFELDRAEEGFIGRARWSPDGRRVVLVGPGYSSIRVIDRSGELVSVITTDGPTMSGAVSGPAWLDDDTIVFHDASPAVVTADAASGELLTARHYDPETEVFPVLLVPDVVDD